MDGLLVVDKPAGPTSHDIVDRVRHVLGERRVGHTGTLDPAATGVLPLVVGRATRLARFLSANDKAYTATIRLGVSTDTRDANGTPLGSAYTGPWPELPAIDEALDAFRGTFLQQPPAYSAKKVGGRRSYALARQKAQHERAGQSNATPTAITPADDNQVPAPALVTAHAIAIEACNGPDIVLHVDCSSGFYVRSLAHDLGQRIGTGAHLVALRRTRVGDITLDQATALDAIERDPARGRTVLVPLSRMLPAMASVTLTSEGVRRATEGRDVGGAELAEGATTGVEWLRLVNDAGELVAIATPTGLSGVLHPAVVLV